MKELDAFLARHPHHGCLPLPSSPLSPVLPGMPPQQLYERGSGIDGLFAEMTSHVMPPDTAVTILSQLYRDEARERYDVWAVGDAQRAAAFSGARNTRRDHVCPLGPAQLSKETTQNARHTYHQPMHTEPWAGRSPISYPPYPKYARRHRVAEHTVHARAGAKRAADAMDDTLPRPRTARTTTDYMPYHNAPATQCARRPAADVPFVHWRDGARTGGALGAGGHHDEPLRLPPIRTPARAPAPPVASASPAPSPPGSPSSASTLHTRVPRMAPPAGGPGQERLLGAAAHPPPGARRLACEAPPAPARRTPRADGQEAAPPQDVRAKRRRTEEWVRSQGGP